MSRQSLILEVGTRAVFHTILLFSVFLLLSGHNAPGGGFVGGLVAGAALVLRDVAADFRLARSRFRPEDILSVGLLIAVATGAVGLIRGGHFLDMDKVTIDLPFFGQVKATYALPFDIGVFFIVVGVILTIVERLGEELEQ